MYSNRKIICYFSNVNIYTQYSYNIYYIVIFKLIISLLDENIYVIRAYLIRAT